VKPTPAEARAWPIAYNITIPAVKNDLIDFSSFFENV
jgi:hypothetical protein